MEQKLKQLKETLHEISDLSGAIALLGWDQQVNMPRGGAEDRGLQLSLLSSIIHEKATAPEAGKRIEALVSYGKTLDPDSDDARLIKVAARLAQSAWEEAKEKDDFAIFQPHLEKIVEMRRQYASFFEPYKHIYDPLLDDFEPGMSTQDVKDIFAAVRPVQVALLKQIAARPQVDDSFLHITYPEQGQWDFGVEVITRFGFDWNRGRQDKSVHPFTTSFGLGDVRITTRFDPERAASALFSTMHEGGHALYEQGIAPALGRTPLATGASLAVHESQSRLWENLVGRSLPFWKFFYPRFQKIFPEQVGKLDLMSFYKGINKVEPSFIRVEADEATYNMHIMLRLELEIALMEGSLAVRDLPEAWNARMQEYLGITPPTNQLGVLQDVHWSGGMIGYFPTYALGNLISCQLWETMHVAIPDLDTQIEHGEFSALLGWLRTNIHQHGAKFEPQELVQRVTGSKIDPQPYLRYLQTKFGSIYGI